MSDLEGRRRPGRPRDLAVDVSILDAAERVLSTVGYAAMTIEQVATEAGVSKPTIYLRYRTKLDLVRAMINQLEFALPPIVDDLESDLHALLTAQRRWIERHGLRLGAALLLEDRDHPELAHLYDERVLEPFRTAVAETLRGGVGRGELRVGADSEQLIDALTGAAWSAGWTKSRLSSEWVRQLVSAFVGQVGVHAI